MAKAASRPPPRVLTPEDADKLQRHKVKAMVSTQTPITAIAEMLGISVTQLRKQYSMELKRGHDYVYAHVSLGLINDAFSGDIRAKLAWLRQFGGWQEIIRRELTGKNGEPISIRSLDAASLVAIAEALGPKGRTGRGAGGNQAQIDLAASDVEDLDAVPRPTDEGTEQ